MEVKPNIETDYETVHDFLNERLILKVMACVNVLRTSKLHYSVNMLFVACTFLLYSYMLAMCVYTLAIPETGTAFKVEVVQILGDMSLVFAIPAFSFYYRANFEAAMNALKAGFDMYADESPEPEHAKLKRQRVKQVRLWCFIFRVLCYQMMLFYALRTPVTYALGLEDDSLSGLINPYLPLPLYAPFDTATYHGFAIAFLSNMMYLFLLYTVLTCLTETYLSSTLQLLAQIEIFNYSLTDIQNRANLKFNADKSSGPMISSKEEENLELQNSLYICLKRSLQHHQAIIMYYQEVKEYLGAMNTYFLLVFAFQFASSIVPVLQDPLGNLALIIHLMTELTGYFQIFMVAQVISDEAGGARCEHRPKDDLKKLLRSLEEGLRKRGVSPEASASLHKNMEAVQQVLKTQAEELKKLFAFVKNKFEERSSNSIDSLYSTPWTRFNKRYNVMLNIMLTTAKKPIVLRAPFFNADWTLETFGGMLSGAYKLVNILLSAV